jgi:hypothetical protein
MQNINHKTLWQDARDWLNFFITLGIVPMIGWGIWSFNKMIETNKLTIEMEMRESSDAVRNEEAINYVRRSQFDGVQIQTNIRLDAIQSKQNSMDEKLTRAGEDIAAIKGSMSPRFPKSEN